MRTRNRFFWIVKAVLMGAVMILVVGVVIMFLWNNVVVEIFAAPELSWIQAIGLFVLAKILFGGGHGKHGWKHKFGGGPSWQSKWRSRWANMDPEARERACRHFQHKWYGKESTVEVQSEGNEKKEDNS